MITMTSPPLPLSRGEQRTILENISWSTFETLLQEIGHHRGYRFTYDRGTLEMMSPDLEHESHKSNLGNFVIALAEQEGCEIKSAGSTTLKLQQINRSIEPDHCYYIQNEPAIRGKKTLDLTIDPPPDLAIEIDITNSSINKSELYAALGVPEIWRYDGKVLKFLRLVDGVYIESDFSLAFPLILATEISQFLENSQNLGEIALLKSFRAWLKNKIDIE